MNSKPPDHYKTIKLKLNQILKLDVTEKLQIKLSDAIFRTNCIQRSAMFYLKDKLLSDPEKIIPLINVNYLDLILQSVCQQPRRGKASTNADVKNDLIAEYDRTVFKLFPLSYEKPTYTNLGIVLDYASQTWMTMIENNIKQRYVSYVETYVNFQFKKYETLENLKRSALPKDDKQIQKRHFLDRLRKMKHDLLNVTKDKMKCDENDRQWVTEHKKIVLPFKGKFREDSVYYDIQCKPMDYLLPMFRIMKLIEESQDDNKPRLKNVLPHNTSLKPNHIRIDTTTLFLFTRFKTVGEEFKHLVWDEYFQTNRKCFKMKGYKFNNSITTDGVSCCLLFIREDLYGKKYTMKLPKILKEQELYLEDLTDEKREQLKNRNIVGIDPNMGNLLYCVDSNGRKMRYTQSQRNVETKKHKFQEILVKRKKEKVNGKTIEDWEATLSCFDSKTLDRHKYHEYLIQRLIVDSELLVFYQDEIYRKLSLSAYRNRKTSEMCFMQKFTKYFGKDAVVCIGDWEQKNHMKFKQPSKGKGFRKTIRDHGFELYLIDEFKTSKQCNYCKNEEAIMEKCMRRKYIVNGEEKTSELLHGLLKCKTCERLCNRDANSSKNQRDIAEGLISGTGRPKYLERKHQIAEVTV